MRNDVFTSMENEAIQLIVRNYPCLLDQAKNAIITKREFTGVGFYSYFHINQSEMYGNDMQISDVGAKINDRIQVGFLLFVKKGQLDLLECYTYGDPWPDMIQSYEIFTL
jgi:hypothetical protein